MCSQLSGENLDEPRRSTPSQWETTKKAPDTSPGSGTGPESFRWSIVRQAAYFAVDPAASSENRGRQKWSARRLQLSKLE